MMNVYLVMGAVGEYSDHEEWYVAVYIDHDLAKEHVRLATEAGNAIVAEAEAKRQPDQIWGTSGRVPTLYDPNFQWDYSRFQYYCNTVPLLHTLPGETLEDFET